MLSLLLPVRCAVCDRLGAAVCAACLAAFVRIGRTGCARCGAPGAWPVSRCAECSGRRLAFATARAAIAYDDRAAALVRSWKEHGRRDLARVAASIVAEHLSRPGVDVLVFVPADSDRRLERGHAPPERLARELGHVWGIPVRPALGRARRIAPQRGLGRSDRRANVRGAFAGAERVPARVCLVDDVYTTGATMHACASALRRSGARRVECVSLARAVR